MSIALAIVAADLSDIKIRSQAIAKAGNLSLICEIFILGDVDVFKTDLKSASESSISVLRSSESKLIL